MTTIIDTMNANIAATTLTHRWGMAARTWHRADHCRWHRHCRPHCSVPRRRRDLWCRSDRYCDLSTHPCVQGPRVAARRPADRLTWIKAQAGRHT